MQTTLEPPIESVLDAGARYVRTGVCSVWEDSYKVIEGTWIRWLRRASGRPKLFMGVTAVGEFFLGSWTFKPGAGPNLGCFNLIENLGRTSPDHNGPRRDRPAQAYLLERLRTQGLAERDAKALSVDRERVWRERMMNEKQHNATWAKVLAKRSGKWAKVLSHELERGLANMGPEE